MSKSYHTDVSRGYQLDYHVWNGYRVKKTTINLLAGLKVSTVKGLVNKLLSDPSCIYRVPATGTLAREAVLKIVLLNVVPK